MPGKEKQVKFKKDAIDKIKKGLDIVADAVKSTLGPKGRNAFIDSEYQPKITNDGVSIAQAITLEDKFENMGAWLVKNTSAQTNEEAGDGTSTTAVLLQSIVEEALLRPENPMDIKKSLLDVGKKVEKWIKESSQEIKENQIEAVATISSEDVEIGKLVAEVVTKVGKDVPITIEENRLPETVYQIMEGLETKVGLLHPIFVNNQADQTAEYENIPVVAIDRRLSSLVEIQNLLKQLDNEKITSVVFLCGDIDNVALGQLVVNKAQGRFNSVAIRVRGQELEDMTAMTGATLISESSGIKLSDVKLEHLGIVKKIIANDKKTILFGSEQFEEHRKNAVAKLLAQAENTKNIYEAKAYTKRAMAIKGGIAVVKVGAHTDSERTYLKDKIEDALNATKSALDEGLVEGGGMCLYRISNKIKGNSVGEEILRKSLKAPLKAIIENAGKDYTAVIKRLSNSKGYDASNDKNVDMFKAGIIDPTKVTRCAFANALSTASTFITSGVAITDIVDKK